MSPVRIEAAMMIFCPVAWTISHAGVPAAGPKKRAKMKMILPRFDGVRKRGI